MDKCLECSKRAMARCSSGKTCAKYGGHFIEGSHCHQFNIQVSLQPFTEADRIRAMNDEELADEFMMVIRAGCDVMGYKITHDRLDACKEILLRELQKPAEEDFL